MLDNAINANAEMVRKGECRASLRWLLAQLRDASLCDMVAHSYRNQITRLWGDR
jgi:hypothetical protein